MGDYRTQTTNTLDELLDARATSYRELVESIQAAVEQQIPKGSTVLVVTKGDPALLSLGERLTWHFPRAEDGQYAGFHPSDSEDAIRRLEALCKLGAEYLVIPASSAWWLDHYSALTAHLQAAADTLLSDPAIGFIFRLRATTTQEALTPTSDERAMRPSTQQLAALLEAVLPSTATLALIAPRGDEIVTQTGFQTVTFRHTDEGTDVDQAIADLRGLSDGLADYLVVPALSREWLLGHPSLHRHIETSYRLVTDQRNVCRIYNLAPEGRGRLA
jgi:hypothetical protein